MRSCERGRLVRSLGQRRILKDWRQSGRRRRAPGAALIGYAKAVHVKKAGRHFALCLALLLAIVYRCIANSLAKERAKRTKALKADFKAYVGDRKPSVSEELFGFFNAPINQVLMWCS